MTLQELRSHKPEILATVGRHGGRPGVRVCGSLARGESGQGSDVDLLIELEPGRSLLDRVEIQNEHEDLLGTRVDALSPAALHAMIRHQVLAEAIPL